MANRHLVIPDMQLRPGVRTNHVAALGNYIAEWKPEVIVCLGDAYEMNSLCVYDKDLADVSQRRYAADLKVGDDAFDVLMAPWQKIKGYKPRLIYTLGNHEERALRLLEAQPILRGAIAMPWDHARSRGWEVYDFLKPVTVDGVTYAHLFAKSANGRVTNVKYGAPNARTQVLREMRSCTAGHKPGIDIHVQPIGKGAMRGLICGSFYSHNDKWMTPQGQTYWRGVIVKHQVKRGNYDMMEVSLEYLLRKWS